MRELKILKPIAALENAAFLDPIVTAVKGVADAVIQPQDVRDALHGVPLGHPVHPVLVLVPTGAWTSAALLDLVPGAERAARILVGLGLLSAAPTALAGVTDWSRLHEQQMRVGVIHATANVTAIGLYTASWLARRRGAPLLGKALGFLGYGAVTAGGYLGGHLVYRQAAGANHTEQVPHRFPEGWQRLARLDELPDRELSRRDVSGQPLLVFRRGGRVDVLSSICSHLGGPLNEGRLGEDAQDGACVTCPWHGSVFALESGQVVHGPATSPVPLFRTRIVGDDVEVMLPNAG
jgi:nitrite reductase/ring-hydroxylating ferredoxin subunit/uncharacterized membrane protein